MISVRFVELALLIGLGFYFLSDEKDDLSEKMKLKIRIARKEAECRRLDRYLQGLLESDEPIHSRLERRRRLGICAPSTEPAKEIESSLQKLKNEVGATHLGRR